MGRDAEVSGLPAARSSGQSPSSTPAGDGAGGRGTGRRCGCSEGRFLHRYPGRSDRTGDRTNWRSPACRTLSLYGGFCVCAGKGHHTEPAGRHQSLFSWVELLTEDTQDTRHGRNGKPKPASTALFEWALIIGQQREEEAVGTMRWSAKTRGRPSSERWPPLIAHVCGLFYCHS